jgi:hypothetical protein
MTKVFHGISQISKVFRENETLDKTLEFHKMFRDFADSVTTKDECSTLPTKPSMSTK